MSHHEETFAVDVPDDSGRALERLVEFYRHNGYSSTCGGDDTHRRTLVRGTSGASWWSSNMARLKTEVTIDVDDEGGHISYRVQTSGQHLTEDDRAFWEHETMAASDYLHRRATLVDLRPAEAQRAQRVQKEYRSFGLQAAVFIVLAIVVAGVVGAHLGFL